jgi:acyl-CoA reductase-like NAD-dependent aldehyde dehydrogenase
MSSVSVVSPIDSSVYCQITLSSQTDCLNAVENSHKAFHDWKQVPLEVKVDFINRFIDAFVSEKDAIAKELTHVLGR